MTRQDEKLRLRRRLQDQAVELAARNRWAEAVEVNRQLLTLGEDTDTYNRLGKAYFELGRFPESRDSYNNALRLNSSNAIARKNIERLDDLLAHAAEAPTKAKRQIVDLRLFITETGKTCLTTLVDVPRGPELDVIVTGEKVDLRLDGRNVIVVDDDNNTIGRLEPKLAQRLSELISGGNRYAAAVAHTNGHQIRVLIREVYQDPSQRGRVSFPGKLGETAQRGYVAATRYDEYGDDLLEEEESVEEREEIEEEVFGGEDEELGLDDIEQEIGEDEEMNEE